MTDQTPPFPEVEQPSRSILRNLSFVWLVPLLALIAALGIAWQAYSDRGTLIEIRFENAAGVAAGETTLRYRDVVIGTVEEVSFTDDLQAVLVGARIDAMVLPYLDEDATFWVVRPEISTQGVSGLSTVVSGVYIEGAWDNNSGSTQTEFVGRAAPLFVRPSEEGRVLNLRVPPGMQLAGGAPVSYRGITVGRLQEPILSEDGQSLTVDVFIEAPHDQRITDGTRFWDTSGFSINLGAEGLSLDVESLASLVTGGIAFDEVYVGGDPVGPDAQFDVYLSQDAARASAFTAAPVGDVPLSVQFTRIVRGLVPGTRVVMDGTTIGQVTEVQVRVVDTPDGRRQRMVADFAVDAELLGLEADVGADAVYAFLADEVENGLRARLASSGIISSETMIEFAVDYTADPGTLDMDGTPFPVIPWVPAAASTFNATAEGVLERVADLPFEALLDQAIDTLASIEGLAGDPAIRDVPEEAIGLLEDARNLIGGEALQAVPTQAIALLEDARSLIGSDALQAVPTQALGAIADLRRVLSDFEDSNLGERLTTLIAQASDTLLPITAASDRLPVIMENLETLSNTATQLEIEATVASANSVLAGVDAFLSAEGMDEVPTNLATSLSELEALMVQLREANVAASLNATLDAVNSAAADLPGLVDQAESALIQVTTLVASYGARSDFMGDTMAVMNEITTAARAIARLARTIERNPNSLLTGR